MLRVFDRGLLFAFGESVTRHSVPAQNGSKPEDNWVDEILPSRGAIGAVVESVNARKTRMLACFCVLFNAQAG